MWITPNGKIVYNALSHFWSYPHFNSKSSLILKVALIT